METFCLAKSDIEAAFLPYVKTQLSVSSSQWRSIIKSNQKKQWQDRMRRFLFGKLFKKERTQTSILQNYSKQWVDRPFSMQLAVDGPVVPCVWGDQPYMARAVGIKRVHMLYLFHLMEKLQPKTVLEVGSGNGLNLLALAGRFEGLQLTGVELTPTGVAVSNRVLNTQGVPEDIKTFAPQPLLHCDDVTSRVRFMQGSAAQLPFEDNTFDVVFTSLALEQMEMIRSKALSEIQRVAKQHVIMIEPFREYNDGMRRNYILAQSYFSGRIKELTRYKLKPCFVDESVPAKIYSQPVVVLCQTL